MQNITGHALTYCMRHWGLTYTKKKFFFCYLSGIHIYLGSLLFVGLLNLAAWQEHGG